MLAVIGTVPDPYIPIIQGQVECKDNKLYVESTEIDINRGTPALLASTATLLHYLQKEPAYAFLVGDVGLGHGSRELYSHLSSNIQNYSFQTLVFHYLQPDVDDHLKVLMATENMLPRPKLIADAGFMYAAKMSGESEKYDLFTPDVGELAFLADENAPHPFYTRGFILAEENKAPELIQRAYKHNNAAKHLLVKGKQDYVANREGIIDTIEWPMVEAMEAIGGTGDMLTGITSVLIDSGIEMEKALGLAARIGRTTGLLADPSPAFQIKDIINHIPEGYDRIINSSN